MAMAAQTGAWSNMAQGREKQDRRAPFQSQALLRAVALSRNIWTLFDPGQNLQEGINCSWRSSKCRWSGMRSCLLGLASATPYRGSTSPTTSSLRKLNSVSWSWDAAYNAHHQHALGLGSGLFVFAQLIQAAACQCKGPSLSKAGSLKSLTCSSYILYIYTVYTLITYTSVLLLGSSGASTQPLPRQAHLPSSAKRSEASHPREPNLDETESLMKDFHKICSLAV